MTTINPPLRHPLSRVMLGLLAITVFLAGFLYGQAGRASSVEPGSHLDPLVAQSYVDQFVQLVVLELLPGQILEGMGGTEIIVRSGQVRAIASAHGGMCNVTAGRDLANNERVSLNHLLIVPRSDGRGILAETRAFVMVRGPYAIK